MWPIESVFSINGTVLEKVDDIIYFTEWFNDFEHLNIFKWDKKQNIKHKNFLLCLFFSNIYQDTVKFIEYVLILMFFFYHAKHKA
jgi:hypothetical protein